MLLGLCFSGFFLGIAGPAPQAIAGESATVFGEQAAFREAMSAIQKDQLKEFVSFLADDSLEGREAGKPGARAAAGYIIKRFETLGLAPAGEAGSYFQEFDAAHRNILARIHAQPTESGDTAAAQSPLEKNVLMIGAHYDHVGYGSFNNSFGPTGFIHNGADDNASGVAALLEVAEAFTKLPFKPRRAIVFCLWDAEEKGLLGSKHWADHPTVPLDKISLYINLDMVGRMRENGLEIYGWRTAVGVRKSLCEANVFGPARLAFPWHVEDNSDHYTFLQKRIPALMLHTGLHDNYHRPSDDVERVNMSGLEQVSRYTFALAWLLANQEASPPFRTTGLDEDKADESRLDRESQTARLGISWDKDIKDAVVVSKISLDSPAALAGVRLFDRVIAVDGKKITTGDALQRRVASSPEKIHLEVERAGEPAPLTLQVKLAGQPSYRGLQVRQDDAEPGVLVVTKVLAGDQAEKAGLTLHDRILSVQGQPPQGPAWLQALLSRQGEVQLTVESQGNLRTLNLPDGTTDNVDL